MGRLPRVLAMATLLLAAMAGAAFAPDWPLPPGSWSAAAQTTEQVEEPSQDELSDPEAGSLQETRPAFSVAESLRGQGLAYGPYRDGQGPDQKIFPTPEQIAEDLGFLGRLTGHLRSYSVGGTLGSIPALAREHGLSVAQGIYLGEDPEANQVEIAAALDLARQGLVDSLIVGNESLTLSRLSKEDLVFYLRQVRMEAPPGIPVTTAEAWSVWRDNPDLADEVDFALAHFHPYWEDHPIAGAAARVFEEYGELTARLQEAHPERTIEIVIGETGWPTGDGRLPGLPERAVPSGENQARFLQEFTRLAAEQGVRYYYFDLFDEEWKWPEGGSDTAVKAELPRDRTFSGRWPGSSWGLFQSDGRLKPDLAGLLEQPDPGSRLQRDLFVGGQLATYYDIGVDSSGGRRDWLSRAGDALQISYPAGQTWGAVFVTVGAPSDPPRPWRDFSAFGALSLELKGSAGGESLEIGVKDYDDANDGGERKLLVSDLTPDWQSFTFPLDGFASSRFTPPQSLERLNVAVEFVFGGPQAQTVFVRNVRYLPAAP